MLVLSLEIVALASYCFVGMVVSPESIEATTRYFIMGSLSSCLLLFGIMVLFAVEGSVFFTEVPSQGAPLAVYSTFVLAGLLIKLGAAPFHF